jgi:hypothetical protein
MSVFGCEIRNTRLNPTKHQYIEYKPQQAHIVCVCLRVVVARTHWHVGPRQSDSWKTHARRVSQPPRHRAPVLPAQTQLAGGPAALWLFGCRSDLAANSPRHLYDTSHGPMGPWGRTRGRGSRVVPPSRRRVAGGRPGRAQWRPRSSARSAATPARRALSTSSSVRVAEAECAALWDGYTSTLPGPTRAGALTWESRPPPPVSRAARSPGQDSTGM